MINKRPLQKTRREKRRFKKRTILRTLSILAIVGSFFSIMNNDYLAIEDITIQGQKTIIETDITTVVRTYLSEYLFAVLPRDNILILNTNEVQRRIEAAFPRIEDIDVTIEDGDTLSITIGERSAHSLWCVHRDYESVFDEECYFSDSEGLLYARAPYFSGNVYMKFFMEPKEEAFVYVGSSVDVVDSFNDFFVFLKNIEEQYPITIERVFFEDFDDVALELSSVRSVTYEETKPQILYNQSDSYEKIMRNVGIVLNFETFEKDFTYRPSALESIDVRFDGRVFYTFTPIGGRTIKDEEIIETTQETDQE